MASYDFDEEFRNRGDNYIPEDDGLIGVFGGKQDHTAGPDYGNGRIRQNQRSVSSQMGTWPWVDIFGIGITVLLFLWGISNFESITDTIFYTILPFISDVFLLGIIIGALLLFLWFRLNTGRRRRW